MISSNFLCGWAVGTVDAATSGGGSFSKTGAGKCFSLQARWKTLMSPLASGTSEAEEFPRFSGPVSCPSCQGHTIKSSPKSSWAGNNAPFTSFMARLRGCKHYTVCSARAGLQGNSQLQGSLGPPLFAWSAKCHCCQRSYYWPITGCHRGEFADSRP